MCGIAGLASGSPGGIRAGRETVERMVRRLAHRGPDGEGIWMSESGQCGLGHRRLSIIDLSEAGHQPMESACGRYVLTFNGEIYNFADLRDELQGLGETFCGHSDTEVLLQAIAHWGLDAALRRTVGMFALGLWDRVDQTLSLARDRMGEKPLYYGQIGEEFVFASELKAITEVWGTSLVVDEDATALFLRLGFYPAPYTVYRQIRKLPAATWTTVCPKDRQGFGNPQAYWSLEEAALTGIANPIDLSPDEAIEELERHLLDSIRGQMIADVPLGAFLSAGIDSTLIVALMQKLSARPIQTFTIGSLDPRYNEAPEARRVAQHLGAEHTEHFVSPEEALAVIPSLPTLYDEPFGDSSQIPTHLVARMARQKVTVSLSGEGGDELFGGYNRYVEAASLWRSARRIPGFLRTATSRACLALPSSVWDGIAGAINRLLPPERRHISLSDKIQKAALGLGARDADELYVQLCSLWIRPEEAMTHGRESSHLLNNRDRWPNLPTATDRAMFMDSAVSLPDDMLVKVDRASMAVGLEVRAPFLDHRTVEFAWKLPPSMKIQNREGKWLLRQLRYRYVPKSMTLRPKSGFEVPISSWLRGPLREWAESLLSRESLEETGVFRVEAVRKVWTEHLTGRRNRQRMLWNILMFQAWHSNRQRGDVRLDQSLRSLAG